MNRCVLEWHFSQATYFRTLLFYEKTATTFGCAAYVDDAPVVEKSFATCENCFCDLSRITSSECTNS